MVTWPMTSRDLEKSRSWPQYVWGSLSRKWLEIETRLQWSTYMKWHLGNQMVTWPMTSRDLELRSRMWPRYVWDLLSRKWLEIEARSHWSTYMYRKWHLTNQMVTWPMTSRDLESSRSRPRYIWGPLSRKWLETETWLQLTLFIFSVVICNKFELLTFPR